MSASPLRSGFHIHNIVVMKTDVMAASCGVIPLLGVRGWTLPFPGETSRPKARTGLCWMLSGLFPGTRAACLFARLLKSSLQNHKAISQTPLLLVSTCSRTLDCSNLSSWVPDCVFAHAAFPEASGRHFEAELQNIRG